MEVVFWYLCEAHAVDKWPLSPQAPRDHKNISERHSAAQRFLAAWPQLQSILSTSLIESLDDATTISAGLWPEKFLLLDRGRVLWQSALDQEPEWHCVRGICEAEGWKSGQTQVTERA